MLHKVNRPNCAAQMRAILRLQYKVLAFACSPKTRLPLDDAAVFERKLGRAGSWIFKCVQRKADFHDALVGLIKHVNGDHVRRRQILQAFLNDTRFHQRWSDESFTFAFRQLGLETQQRVRTLMELFYDYLLELGFPAAMFDNDEKFDRENFSGAFWQANNGMRLCPACDGPRPPEIRGKVYSENDHFFPKSRYPFLAVHASNLLPVCKYCNQSFKQAGDPIDYAANESLASSFLPYELPARDYLTVLVGQSPSGERLVELQPTEPKHQGRLKNLKRLLRLDERWAGEIKAIIDLLLDELQYGTQQEERIDEILDDTVEECLTRELRKREAQIGRKDGSLVAIGYLRFALGNTDELNLLRQSANNV